MIRVKIKAQSSDVDCRGSAGRRARKAPILVAIALLAVSVAPRLNGQSKLAASPGALPAKTDTGRPPASKGDDDEYFKAMYRSFYDSYKLGPADAIALRVYGQADYSFERLVVSPVGRIYHPLLGDVEVARLTVDEVRERLTSGLSQYLIDPKVSVSLVEANSAKVGVLGEVTKPGIVLLSRPMAVLDAISEAGGFTAFGSKSSVILIRPLADGRMVRREINVKRIMDAQAKPEDNVSLLAGDVLVVGQNAKAKLTFIASLVGFGNFLAYLGRM